MKIRIAKEDLVKALKKVIGGIGVGGKDLDYLKITADSTGVEFMTTGRLLGIKTKVSERLEDGNCGNADLHSDSICHLYTFQRVGICPS